METNFITIDDCTQEVEITLSNSELQPYYNKAYAESAKLIEVPGFRKGKVPLPIIKQRFGRSIENEALENIANEEFTTIARRDNLTVLGNPALRDIRKTPAGITFVIRYEMIPQFELANYKNLNLVKPSYEVTDEEVQNQIDEMLLQAGTFEPAEQVTDFMHVVTVKFTLLDDETNMPIIGEIPHEDQIFLENEDVDDDLKNSLMNTRVGDTFNYVAPAEGEQDLPKRYTCTVMIIEKVIPQEFTDEFAMTYSKGRMETAEALRADLKKFLQKSHEDKARQAIENQIFDILVDAHDFAVPNTLVQTVGQVMFDDMKKRMGNSPEVKNMKIQDFSDFLIGPATRNARWEIIYNKIIEDAALDIAEDDLESYYQVYEKSGEKYTREQLREYFLSEQRIIGPILMKKMYDYVIAESLITEIPLKEYLRQEEERRAMLDGQIPISLGEHDHSHEGHDHSHEGHDHSHEGHNH